MLKEIIFNDEFPYGIQKIYKFKNGFGASVICHKMSYGGTLGLWEIAPLDKNRDFIGITILKWHDDVLGNLTEKEVDNILEEIKQLKGE
jgi:hypothetical protein